MFASLATLARSQLCDPTQLINDTWQYSLGTLQLPSLSNGMDMVEIPRICFVLKLSINNYYDASNYANSNLPDKQGTVLW